MSALANAAQKNHGDVAYELVARGADPDDAGFVDDDAVAHNLLWDAVAAGNEAFAALLVAKGAACGAADARGSTALVNAAHKGLNATVDALLAGGAADAVVKWLVLWSVVASYASSGALFLYCATLDQGAPRAALEKKPLLGDDADAEA
mmetsp:Transcript_2785/g.9461  ORF Transcript_2785/g.9461 Transcript_2785/m.9461 type:complete len:149 (-) Transcript_2785:89-535(-)